MMTKLEERSRVRMSVSLGVCHSGMSILYIQVFMVHWECVFLG